MSDNCELVMPFVVVTSQGGPFDDDTYTAGWEAGSIARHLWDAPAECLLMRFTCRSANVPQLDLVAMDAGFVTETEIWADDDSWSFMTFRRDQDEQTDQA